jgi:hypothetical protein
MFGRPVPFVWSLESRSSILARLEMIRAIVCQASLVAKSQPLLALCPLPEQLADLYEICSPPSLPPSSILLHPARKQHTHQFPTSSEFSKHYQTYDYNELHTNLPKLSNTYLLNGLQQILPQQQCLPMFRTQTTSPTSPVTTIPFSGTIFCTQNTWSKPMRRLCPRPHWPG